ncbi:hypothetical protein [Spongiimicrobium sp. 3-5]|uniref:hypothetical protein n=1 Tax=Spongiimicrobium sp. 3-5 TaxID=3332596 RepID=UPI00397FB4CB
MKKLIYNTLFLLGYGLAHAQTGIGTTTPNPDAALEIEAVDKGLLLPRVALINTTNAAPLSAHVAGMCVYNTTNSVVLDPGYYFNDGTQWVSLVSKGDLQSLPTETNTTLSFNDTTGELIYTNEVGNNAPMSIAAAEPWFGTDDNTGATSNTENIYTLGKVGIGDTNPIAKLSLGSDANTDKIHLFRSANGQSAYGLGIGSYQLQIYTPNTASDRIAFGLRQADGSFLERMRLRSNGRLGIGDTNPIARLSLGASVSTDKLHVFPRYGFGISSYQLEMYTDDGPSDHISFGYRASNGTFVEKMRLNTVTGGSLGIGTTTPTEKLHVSGNIKATGNLQSGTATYPDYVFENYLEGESTLNKDYTFKSLDQVERFIKTNKHLPGVTCISELEKTESGYNINMTALSVQTLEKVEELYLHTIAQQKQISAKDKMIQELQGRLSRLESVVETLVYNENK